MEYFLSSMSVYFIFQQNNYLSSTDVVISEAECDPGGSAPAIVVAGCPYAEHRAAA